MQGPRAYPFWALVLAAGEASGNPECRLGSWGTSRTAGGEEVLEEARNSSDNADTLTCLLQEQGIESLKSPWDCKPLAGRDCLHSS